MGRTALPRFARELAAEIAFHDWSDAPFRTDRAGHIRSDDRPGRRTEALTAEQTDNIRLNVSWVVAQILGYHGYLRDDDDVYEFMDACDVDTRTTAGRRSGVITAGLRRYESGEFMPPYGSTYAGPNMHEHLYSGGPETWTDLDYADEEPVDLPLAANLVTSWLAKRKVPKLVTSTQVRGALRSNWDFRVITRDDTRQEYVEVGALREWFRWYWDKNHVPKPDLDDAPF